MCVRNCSNTIYLYNTQSYPPSARLLYAFSRVRAPLFENSGSAPDSGITVVKQLGLLTVLERRDYLILITVFKCLNDLAPHYLSDLFVYVCDVHNRVTRQTNIGDLYVFNATTAYIQKSLQYSGSLLWNRLPQHIRNATNLNIFKRLCKSWLLSQRDSN